MALKDLPTDAQPREKLLARGPAALADAELAKLAMTDSLTGLSNRRAILSEFNRLFAQAQREQKYVLVAVIAAPGVQVPVMVTVPSNACAVRGASAIAAVIADARVSCLIMFCFLCDLLEKTPPAVPRSGRINLAFQ